MELAEVGTGVVPVPDDRGYLYTRLHETRQQLAARDADGTPSTADEDTQRKRSGNAGMVALYVLLGVVGVAALAMIVLCLLSMYKSKPMKELVADMLRRKSNDAAPPSTPAANNTAPTTAPPQDAQHAAIAAAIARVVAETGAAGTTTAPRLVLMDPSSFNAVTAARALPPIPEPVLPPAVDMRTLQAATNELTQALHETFSRNSIANLVLQPDNT